MIMDQDFTQLPAFNFDYQTYSPGFIQSPDFTSDFDFQHTSSDLPSYPHEPDPGPSAHSSGSDVDSPDEFSGTVLKYLNQILLEEKLEDKPSMFHDPLALQAAERSFYQVIGEKYPPSPLRQTRQSHDENFFTSSSDNSSSSTSGGSNMVDPQWVLDSIQNYPSGYLTRSNVPINPQSSLGSMTTTDLLQDIFSDSESILQFKRGMEEASKFLPTYEPFVIDLDKYSPPPKEGGDVKVQVKKEERENSPNGSRGRKHYHEDNFEFEERSRKQSAVFKEDVELSELFDRILLCTDSNGEPVRSDEGGEEENTRKLMSQKEQKLSANGVKNRSKKQGSRSEVVDLRTLLISCAQSVAADDRRTASEQLQQIRQHSSSSGDSSQRLAHIFANGLEARLAGTGTQVYKALSAKQLSATEKLMAFNSYLSASPILKFSFYFATRHIYESSIKAPKIHIIDFGIQYGFQWPMFIQLLSYRPDGPPELCITGIERPQPGFRPEERLQETGRRLASYCERFHVPFKYKSIASQNWENIKIEDLMIQKDEFVAVNSLLRFENVLDETIVLDDSPRDSVLKLIRKMNPNIFVLSVVNGSHSAPFFVTRFREVLFHYSALFDMFENTLSHDDQHRTNFEKEFYGREVMNVIACEGSARVERPETYKQWQVRNMRAGFKPFPLDKELVKKFKNKLNTDFHKDFVLDEDGHWMLQGWKGRILYASSCWVPARKSM